mgnify:CR=1 FL=1
MFFFLIIFLLIRRTPRSTLFPSTLFRSQHENDDSMRREDLMRRIQDASDQLRNREDEVERMQWDRDTEDDTTISELSNMIQQHKDFLE